MAVSVPIHVTFLVRPAPSLDSFVDFLFIFDVCIQLISGYMDRGLNFIRQAVGMPAQPPAASSLDTLEA